MKPLSNVTSVRYFLCNKTQSATQIAFCKPLTPHNWFILITLALFSWYCVINFVILQPWRQSEDRLRLVSMCTHFLHCCHFPTRGWSLTVKCERFKVTSLCTVLASKIESINHERSSRLIVQKNIKVLYLYSYVFNTIFLKRITHMEHFTVLLRQNVYCYYFTKVLPQWCCY